MAATAVLSSAIGIGKTLGIGSPLDWFGGGGEKWKGEPQNYSSAPDNAVSFFEHSEYRGRYKSFQSGQSVSNLKSRNFNDLISSIKIPRGMQVTVYEDANFQGASRTLQSDTDFNDKSFNDRISSFRVSGTPVAQRSYADKPAGQQASGSGSRPAGQQAGGMIAGAGSWAKYLVYIVIAAILGYLVTQNS